MSASQSFAPGRRVDDPRWLGQHPRSGIAIPHRCCRATKASRRSAGFVLSQLQKIPGIGDSFEYEGRRYTVARHGRLARGEREDRDCSHAASTAASICNARGQLMLRYLSLALALHAAGGVAGGVGGLPADPPRAGRSHPADAGRRRGRHRHRRGAPRLRTRRSARHSST